MPESPEDLYARVVARVGQDGRLPTTDVTAEAVFPWEVVDGRLVTKVLQPPLAIEAPRVGDDGGAPCGTCAGESDDLKIWENERWFVNPLREPSGLLVLFLQSKEHQDFNDLDDEMAAEYGRLSVTLCRIMTHLDHVGRVHVNRWGDGSQHLHVWFIARPARFEQVIGSMAVEWDLLLPPLPEEVRRADLAAIAARLATHDGRALV